MQVLEMTARVQLLGTSSGFRVFLVASSLKLRQRCYAQFRRGFHASAQLF